MTGAQLCLQAAGHRFPAHLVTCRPEDRCVGTAHWVQFAVPPDGRAALARIEQPAAFAFDNGTYQHQSAPLSDDLRQSLLDDLQLSDHDDQRQAG